MSHAAMVEVVARYAPSTKMLACASVPVQRQSPNAHASSTASVSQPNSKTAPSPTQMWGTNTLSSAMSGTKNEGLRDMLKASSGGRVAGVGFHEINAGLSEHVAAVVARTGHPVDRIDTFGHNLSGFATAAKWKNLNSSIAKRLAPNLSPGAILVAHGCMGKTGVPGYIKPFLQNLPKSSKFYCHRMQASPGQPFNWMKHQLVEKNGKTTVQSTLLKGNDKVIGTLLPESFVRGWCRHVGAKELRKALRNPLNTITNDARAVMADEYRKMTGKDI